MLAKATSMLVTGLLLSTFGVTACAADDLIAIGNDTAFYQAKAKREEARREYEKNLAEADRFVNTTTVDDPTYNWIEGVNKKLVAQLQFANGSLMQAKVGDVIDNRGTKVAVIKPGEVVLRRGEKTIRLAATSQTISPGLSPVPNGPVPFPGQMPLR